MRCSRRTSVTEWRLIEARSKPYAAASSSNTLSESSASISSSPKSRPGRATFEEDANEEGSSRAQGEYDCVGDASTISALPGLKRETP